MRELSTVVVGPKAEQNSTTNLPFEKTLSKCCNYTFPFPGGGLRVNPPPPPLLPPHTVISGMFPGKIYRTFPLISHDNCAAKSAKHKTPLNCANSPLYGGKGVVPYLPDSTRISEADPGSVPSSEDIMPPTDYGAACTCWLYPTYQLEV